MVWIIGHRGAAAHGFENTISSMLKAIELGAGMVELDIHVCRSGEIVIIHDLTVDRTTNGNGLIAEMDLDEIKTLYAGEGESVPTLRETMLRLKDLSKVNIELKGEGTVEPLLSFLAEIVQSGSWKCEDILLSSFDPIKLYALWDFGAPFRRGFIFDRSFNDVCSFAAGIGCWSIHPRWDLITIDLVEEAHKKDMKVITWTVNDRDAFDSLVSMGVDGIITDRPEIGRS